MKRAYVAELLKAAMQSGCGSAGRKHCGNCCTVVASAPYEFLSCALRLPAERSVSRLPALLATFLAATTHPGCNRLFLKAPSAHLVFRSFFIRVFFRVPNQRTESKALKTLKHRAAS